MKKIAAALLSAVMLTASLTGCGGSASSASSGAASAPTASSAAPAEKKDLREINVVLDWYPNALHTFIYTAIERGYYAEEGLDVKVQFPANANDALTLVAAGKAEIGLYYVHDTIQAVANQNVGIKSIGAVVQYPLNTVLSLKEKNITGPKDLVGKTLGYAGTARSEALLYSMLESVGASRDDATLVNVGFDLMPALTTNRVDATIGCFVNHEVIQMEEEGFDVNYFMVTESGVPNYYEDVFLANDKMIEEEPEVLESFLRASARGFEDFKADPDGTLAILMDHQNEENFPLSLSVETKSCQVLLPLMETADASFLSQTEDVWQQNIDWMLQVGLIDQPVEPSDVMINLAY